MVSGRSFGEQRLDARTVLAPFALLQAGQFVGVLFDEVGQFVQQPSALGRRHLSPRPEFERPASRLHRSVHILLVGLCNAANFLARGGVHCGKGAARGRLRPPVVDQQLGRRDGDSALRR